MSETDGEKPTGTLSVEFPFAELVEGAPFGVVAIDDRSVVRYANDGVADLLGYDPDDLVGESLLRIVPDRLRKSHEGAFGRYLETGERHLDWDQIELSAHHRDGHEVPVTIALREMRADGEPLYAGILSDNSGQSRLREQLEESIDVLHELYAIASNATLSFETRREEILKLGCQYLGLPYGFVTEVSADTQRIVAAVGDHELIHPGAKCPIEESYCRKTVEEDGFLSVANAIEEGWSEDPAYERFELGSYVGGKLVVEGELFGTVCFAAHEPREYEFTDSERTFVEMSSRWLGYEFQRKRQTRRLERQNERLDQFASQVSHDLRNPLSAAMGRLELAIEEYGDDDDLLAVRQSLEDADGRIDEMLEFARLGNVITDPEPVPVSEAAAAAWEAVDTGDATLTVVGSVELRGDGERIERLLENLFRNAVEHADGDGEVSVRLGPLDGRPGFFVADDGPGIPEDEREAVFESGHTTSEDGSGFGLAIVREIASAHGWTVRVTDSEAGGARFEFDGADPG